MYSSNLLTIPKRSLNGVASEPAFVVAPIRVNLGKSNLIDRALGPLPIMISNVKSSKAGYNISSTLLFNLWISSINKISNSARFVSSAAKSPGFSIAGPEVILIFEFISFDIIFDKVVFPSPGGPYNNT